MLNSSTYFFFFKKKKKKLPVYSGVVTNSVVIAKSKAIDHSPKTGRIPIFEIKLPIATLSLISLFTN